MNKDRKIASTMQFSLIIRPIKNAGMAPALQYSEDDQCASSALIGPRSLSFSVPAADFRRRPFMMVS